GDCEYDFIITRTWIAADHCNNQISHTQLITVVDTSAPVWAQEMPVDVTVDCMEIPAIPENINATDNCGTDVAVSFAETIVEGDCPGNYTLTRTWTATDNCANTTVHTQLITVSDTQAPQISCPENINVVTDNGEQYATLEIPLPQITGECGGYTLQNNFNGTNDASGQYPIGSTEVVYTVTDDCGNVNTCSFVVTVTDNEIPQMECPPTVEVSCEGEVPAPFTSFEAYQLAGGQARDNHEIVESSFIMLEEVNDGMTCPTTISRTYQISDNDGNTATCIHQIILYDQIAPVFTVTPQDITVECDGEGNSTELEAWLAGVSATDNCGAATLTHDFSGFEMDCGETGTAVVTWTASDACGNTTTATATFTIADTTPPVLECVASPMIIFLEEGNQTYTVQGSEFDPVVESDLCGQVVVYHNLSHTDLNTLAGYEFPLGDTQLIWTAEDACGNTTECTLLVRVLTYGLEVSVVADQESYSGPGDMITYTLEVTNSGSADLYNIHITDALTGLDTVLDELPAAMTESYEGYYTTTQQDVLNGSLTNTAMAEADADITVSAGASVTIDYVPDEAPLSIDVTTAHILCHGEHSGSAQAMVEGGTPPYSILWATTPEQTGEQAENLSAGEYQVTATDANGNSVSTTFTINQPAAPLAFTSQTGHLLCYQDNSGSINIQVSGGVAPYQILWDDDNETSDRYNLAAGDYTVTITDNNGCTISETFTVLEPEPIHISNIQITGVYYKATPEGSILFTTAGGTPPYTYLWDNGSIESGLTQVPGGNYNVEIMDAHGCAFSHTFLVPWVTDEEEQETEEVAVSKAFSPNGDNINDQWVIAGLENHPDHRVQVFNRYGTLVFEASPYDNSWDGVPNKGSFYGSGGKLPSGTYYYIITLDEWQAPISGWLYLAH
ncbi:MAG: gliding motility-associated C-terminal domain-containing protein, partial [Bacteroidota bacterium]